jgi:hypothetical protein
MSLSTAIHAHPLAFYFRLDAAVMFLRATIRRKDGKEHRYWSLVENKRFL